MTESQRHNIGRLLVLSGPDHLDRKPVLLDEGCTVTIGRSPVATICIPEFDIARRQCDLDIRGGAAFLLDYGFTRGPGFGRRVAVNGQLLSEYDEFWPNKPWPGPDGETQEYLDELNAYISKEYDKLTPHEVSDGDEIQVGTALFRIELQSGPHATGLTNR